MKIILLLVCVTLCAALVPPIDMCERCIHQFVERHGCDAWRLSVETGHHWHHQNYMDNSCSHFVDSIKGTPQDDECEDRAKMACGFPSDYGDDHHGSDGHGHEDNGNNVPTPVHHHDVIGSGSYEHYHLCDPNMFDYPVCVGLGRESAIGASSQVCECYHQVAAHTDSGDRSCMMWDMENVDMDGIEPLGSFDDVHALVCNEPDLCAGKACGEECNNSNDVTMDVMKYCQPDGTCDANAAFECPV